MTNSRRNFLKKSTLGISTVPILGFSSESNKLSLEKIKNKLSNYSNENYWSELRNHFPTKKGQTYFNNGTLGVTPTYVLEKVIESLRENAINGAETDYKGNGPELLSGYEPSIELRKKIGEIVNCNYKEITLNQNATFGMNFIAHGLELKKGDEVINTNQEHGGGFAAWRQLAERKDLIYKEAIIPVPANDPKEIINSINSQITSKTKILAIPHIISVYGTVMPIKEICNMARQKNIFTVIDGAQAVGQINVDVKDLGCDAYYSSLHKWLLAPAGNGILYITKEKSENIWATLSSYNWNNREDNGFKLQQSGTGNPSLLVGLEATVDFFNMIGKEKWLSRIKHLGDYLRRKIENLNNVEVISSTHNEMCAGITTYKVDDIDGPSLQKTLWDKEKLQPRSVGKELLRHCVHIYNSKEEIDRAVDVIKNLT